MTGTSVQCKPPAGHQHTGRTDFLLRRKRKERIMLDYILVIEMVCG